RCTMKSAPSPPTRPGVPWTPPAASAPPTRCYVMRRRNFTRACSDPDAPPFARSHREHGPHEHGGGGHARPARAGLVLAAGGPARPGRTARVDRLCRTFWPEYDLAVITNDIYPREDAEFLARRDVLPLDRIVGVETGGCPHSAIREDASINLAAIADLEK